jgi:hypothetical protein
VSKPTKVETLGALVRVLDRQAKDARERVAERGARAATDDNVLAAVGHGENTWERLHDYFPESQWKGMAQSLERLQRGEALHRDAQLTFRLGGRKHPWRIETPAASRPSMAPGTRRG